MVVKREKNRKYFRFGWDLIALIPNWLFLIGLSILEILTGPFWLFFILFIAIFIATTMHQRWLLFFAENYFCTFYFIEGKRKMSYENIELISRASLRGKGNASGAFRVYFRRKDKLKCAIFQVGTGSYNHIAKTLNFIKDKVQDGVIDDENFKEIGIEYEGGEYKYLAPISRQYIKRKTDKEL